MLIELFAFPIKRSFSFSLSRPPTSPIFWNREMKWSGITATSINDGAEIMGFRQRLIACLSVGFFYHCFPLSSFPSRVPLLFPNMNRSKDCGTSHRSLIDLYFYSSAPTIGNKEGRELRGQYCWVTTIATRVGRHYSGHLSSFQMYFQLYSYNSTDIQ